MNGRYRAAEPGQIEQTAILRDIDIPEVRSLEAAAEAAVSFTHCAWAIILNQECDLQFDRLARRGEPLRAGGTPVKKDKLLRSVLVCPAFPQDHVTAGTYIEEARVWGSNERKTILGNHEERYHLLAAEEPLVSEPLILDFKLVVAVHPDYLQAWIDSHPDKVAAVLDAPFRDRLMQRFVNYFGRIAEPEE